MKILLALFCMVYLTYADDYIKDIEDEVYVIKKFEKYQDAPYPKPAFADSNSVKLLGWSKNNYLAYFIGSNGVNMSDSCFDYSGYI